ncbi:MAG: hypothetical protein M1819_000648 [Sarea resinae]|nr:MAG: hypothetical protein M1819_000648 [Sarea resinae]
MAGFMRPFSTTASKLASKAPAPSSTTMAAAAAAAAAATSTDHTPTIFREIAALRAHRKDILFSRQTVGLVPTMGALHAGHVSLIRAAAAENSHVFVSIYVNPTQFAVNEDLDSYPRTWDHDLQILSSLNAEFAAQAQKQKQDQSQSQSPQHNADNDDNNSHLPGRISAVFAPTSQTMYPTSPPSSDPSGAGTFITLTPLSTYLEGASRPIFFRGVATVCAKLFNISTPDAVYFGQKDMQQSVIIRRLVRDLHFATAVRVVPTVRDARDGLALSSRNVYLGARRRAAAAAVLPRMLARAQQAYDSARQPRTGLPPPAITRAAVLEPAISLFEEELAAHARLPPGRRVSFELDYLSLADPESLEEVEVVDPARGAVVSVAVRMMPLEPVALGAAKEGDAKEGGEEKEDRGLGGGTGVVRLIDNVVLEPFGKGAV